ncbi:MAG TPA: fatty acid hydroxylase, partial [Exiguobacterium sp.]|nr:fatty acid hydroxylase [Exiguobacterium sp.]
FSWSMLLFFCIGLIVMLLAYEWKHYVAHVLLKLRTRSATWTLNAFVYLTIKNTP